jgi:hypothetical protein
MIAVEEKVRKELVFCTLVFIHGSCTEEQALWYDYCLIVCSTYLELSWAQCVSQSCIVHDFFCLLVCPCSCCLVLWTAGTL